MEVATPHLRGLLVAALSTGGRLRDIPVGQRLAAGLDMLLRILTKIILLSSSRCDLTPV
jgi:hypothetical protein